ncbi:MAG: thiamine pyrophosphate-dependent dehydrogenase E1 component subunit alpha [Gammaproteobacteria bacterium]|nr:thiamine pyrophosphate-dependent dehydrogenase E1 component subunit alpha [Gammaproteobacteria bacterium]
MTLQVDQRREAYRRMLSIRRFEEALPKRIAAGEILGSVHSSIGQEAALVGACMALRDDDYITGTHRSHGHPIAKGAKLAPLMAELMGRATGICKGRGGSMHLADASVGIIGESAIVGGGIPLATGAGLSAHVRGTDQVSLGFFGDGAANQGAFHECINMAAAWKLPVIFFCENNLYAVTTPARTTHGQPDVAKRAAGYAIPGVIVDGQELEAVYEATRTAVERARRGEGPSLIEAKTYRFDEHAIGIVMPLHYRAAEEVECYRRERDPLLLYRARLLEAGHGEAELGEIESTVERMVGEAVEFARKSPHPDPSSVYDYLYSNPIGYPA